MKIGTQGPPRTRGPGKHTSHTSKLEIKKGRKFFRHKESYTRWKPGKAERNEEQQKGWLNLNDY